MYINHVIGTQNELLTSGFRIPSRPTHVGTDYIDAKNLQITPRGVDITAFADGTITNIFYNSARGNCIDISHNSRVVTRYQHLRNGITVKVGGVVRIGDVIGVMGNTGDCRSSRTDVPPEFCGTHLHLELHINGEPVNAEPYLRGEKLLSGTQSVNAVTQSTPTKPIQPSNNFKVGDKVRILPTADKYVTGETIPTRLKGALDEIMQLGETSRNPAIRNADAVLLKHIYSWVKKYDVQKI